MVALIRRTSLLCATALLAAACGGSSSTELLGPGHGGNGGSSVDAGSGAGGTDAGGGASSGGSAGNAGSGASAGNAGSGGHSSGGAGGSAAAGGAGGSNGAAGSAGSGGSSSGGTPGVIQCGAAPCSTQSSVCCVCPGCTIPFPTTCYPKITGCTTGKPVHCDDSADCVGGQVCCAHFDPTTYKFMVAACVDSCPANGNARLCVTDAECKGGTHCTPLASLPGFKACQ